MPKSIQQMRLRFISVTLVSLLVFGALTCFSPQVRGELPTKTICAELLNEPYSILALSPHVQVLMIGLLAEGENGARYLALSDYYWNNHEEMYRELGEKHPLKRILWAGELFVENNQAFVAPGIVVLSINTSGFFKRRIDSLHNDLNDPELLKAALKAHEPALATLESLFFTYEKSDVHLDPLFRALHRRLKPADPYDTVRHRFCNLLNSFKLVYQELTFPGMASERKLERVSRISSSNVSDYLTFIESEASFSARAQRDQRQVRQYCEQIQLLRDAEGRDENYHKQLIAIIEETGPRLNPSKYIEVIEIPANSTEPNSMP